MPPPQPGYFAPSDDPYSLDNAHYQTGQAAPRRKQKATVNSTLPGGPLRQHQRFGQGPPLSSYNNGGYQSIPMPIVMGGDSRLNDHIAPASDRGVDVNASAKIIRGSGGRNGGFANGTANGSGAAVSNASGGRNAPRQQQQQQRAAHQDRESPEPEVATLTREAVAGQKRKRELQERIIKYSKDRYDKRDEICGTQISSLSQRSHLLHQNPAEYPGYSLRLYPIALERAALLEALEHEEKHELETAEKLFIHEMKQIEDEFEKGRTRLRERVMEGIEERRKRARDEKEGEGTVTNESSLEVTASVLSRASTNASATGPPFILGPSIPYGLSPDDLTSPFPLSLTSIAPSNPSHHHPSGPGRKPRAAGRGKDGTLSGTAILALGKAIAQLSGCKEADIDHDLGDIRRAQKRRRAAVRAAGGP